MSQLKNYLLFIVSGALLMTCVHAQSKDPNAYALMTARDLKDSTLSNVTITNGTSKSVTASGLFIVSYDINDCSSCFGNVMGGDNLTGVVASPVTFKANQSVPIGQNFLYNLLYNGIYAIQQTVGTTPCALPGCTWPGDDPNVKGWCININVASLDSSYTYSSFTNGSNPPANIPPFTQTGISGAFNYNYSLINPSTLGTGSACIGPITCDDKALTCKVSVAQNETFRPYS